MNFCQENSRLTSKFTAFFTSTMGIIKCTIYVLALNHKTSVLVAYNKDSIDNSSEVYPLQ